MPVGSSARSPRPGWPLTPRDQLGSIRSGSACATSSRRRSSSCRRVEANEAGSSTPGWWRPPWAAPVQRDAPRGLPFVNDQVDKKRLSTIVNDLAERYSKVQVAATLDALKGVRLPLGDPVGHHGGHLRCRHPAEEARDPRDYETKRATKVQTQFERGLITDEERRQELIEIWTQATNMVAKEMEANLPKTNTIFRMVSSGCSW